MKYVRNILTTALLTLSATIFAQKPTTMPLWPNGPEVVSSDGNDQAELTVYLPDANKATGRAVVCCPGGGYSHLAMDHEGHQWAPFFNTQGSSGFYHRHPCQGQCCAEFPDTLLSGCNDGSGLYT